MVLTAPAAADTLTSGWIDLGSGTLTPYYRRETSVPGPLVMITGGVHGNEPAGAAAANQIRTWSITRGTLVVVPFCAPQALDANTREIAGEGNLNRNFPGINDPITKTTGSTATALWAFTRQVMPQWLIDMHEGIGIASDEASTSVGSSIIHMNESVTNTQVTRMLAAVNATITDPVKKFSDLGSTGPVDTSLARASVKHLGTRGMIVETTSTDQVLALRVNQHRTAVSQFLIDQAMLSGSFGGPRNGVIDEFTFDEPAGTRLTAAGNSFPNGGVWNVSPFDTRVGDGVLRIQRTQSGTSTTSTGVLGAGEVRVRRAGEADNLASDIGEGFATLVVDGWHFRSSQIGETISFGFRNSVSGTVEDTAHLVLRRTGLDEVSIQGLGFGTGSGTTPLQARFPAVQSSPVQFVLQLNKQRNLDGSPLVSGSATGGFFRLFSQPLGQEYVEIGSGAAVRQDRNGNHLTMRISGSVGANGGFFDVERVAFSSTLPGLLVPPSAPGVVNLMCTSGSLTQGRAGFPLVSGTLRIEKTGSGTIVLDAANTLSGSTTVLAGRLHLANAAALAASRLVPLAGGTVTLAPGLKATVGGLASAAGGVVDVGSGMLTIAGGMTPASLVAALQAGRGDGGWSGRSGITSSAAATSGGARTVGWLDDGGGSLSVAFAAAGDTNLDWAVDILDAANLLASGKLDSGLPATWSEGDFTYDGVVDVLDAADMLSTGLLDTGNYAGASGTTASITPVPEPVSLPAVGLLIGFVWRWNRRQRGPRVIRLTREPRAFVRLGADHARRRTFASGMGSLALRFS
ncbi:MAG: succinylglutamate desuccinylase/aspartoacylase family protein [Planctomycetaceae bacterium]